MYSGSEPTKLEETVSSLVGKFQEQFSGWELYVEWFYITLLFLNRWVKNTYVLLVEIISEVHDFYK